jgi:hypothetical protein
MRDPSDAPAPTGVLFPELLGSSEPAPPAHPRGSRLLRMAARIVLWSLIAVGAFRGVVPAGERASPAAPATQAAPAAPAAPASRSSADPADDRRAAAVATAFLREYLTIGDDQAARAERLARYTAAGVDLRRSVSLPAGVAQYADLVVAAGGRQVAGGVEVTVLAHVLQVRSGAYRDGGTLAFVVPLAVGREGIAVVGRPRPAPLPAASGVSRSRPRAPAELARAAGGVARQAVVAFVAGDTATLARLGGGREPSTRPLPSGWRVLGVGAAEVTGPPGALTAQVPVRARPPAGHASYLLPVQVRLEAGPGGFSIGELDAGGSP